MNTGSPTLRLLTVASNPMDVSSEQLNCRRVSATIGVIALILGASIAIPIAMLRAADEPWNPPSTAHIGGNDFSTYCVHVGKDAAFVIAYHGDFGSSTSSDANPETRTWTDSGTITAKKPDITLSFPPHPYRAGQAQHHDRARRRPRSRQARSRPAKVRTKRIRPHERSCLSSARRRDRTPARHRHTGRHRPGIRKEARRAHRGHPAAIHAECEGTDYRIAAEDRRKLAARHEQKLEWGEPVNGLRMALAWPPTLGEPAAGEVPDLYLAVQNVSEAPVRLCTTAEATMRRGLLFSTNGVAQMRTVSEATERIRRHARAARGRLPATVRGVSKGHGKGLTRSHARLRCTSGAAGDIAGGHGNL